MSTILERPDTAEPPASHTPELATESLYLIPIALIDPNPDNPRKRFDPEQLEELAADLRARGVLQSLVVRRRGDRYELIAGERRYRAAQLAGLETVPCRIREYVDEKAALLDMLAENLSRADLNPWEEAQAYAKLIASGMTQGEVAVQFGKSQPTVANTLKLLELPEPVQELVAEGRLSKSKAQQVGRFATSAPEYCLWLAGQVAERGISEAALREALPLTREAVAAGLIQPLYSHSLSFSVSEVCKGCPHLINHRELANPACGNVALFREHEAEGRRRQQEEARRKQREAEAERERMRARLEAQRQKVVPSEAVPAGEAHSAPNTEGPAAEGPTSAATAPPAPEKKQPKLVYYDDLRWKHPTPVVQLELDKLPAGCQGKLCPCAVALPKSEQDPRIIWCCDRPGHHQSLAAKNTRANKKNLRAEFADRIETALHQLRETAAPNSAMLAPIAYRRFKGARKDALRKALDAIGLPWPVELLSLTYFDERLARPQVLAALRGLPVLTLIELCLLVEFHEEAHEAVEWQRDYCPQLDAFLGLEPTAAARKDFQDAVKSAFRTGGSGAQVDANLRAIGQPGIPNPNAPAVSEEQSDEGAEPTPPYIEWREGVTDAPLPADQCPQCGHQLAPEGSCPGCVPPPAEEVDEEVLCFRCGDPLPIAPCAGEECEHLANGVTVDPRGCIATPQGAYYCRSCRPDVRICRECGCTDEAGCDEGCSWVELDLCSACTGQLHLPETEPAKPGKAAATALRIAELEAEIAKFERAAADAASARCVTEKLRNTPADLCRRATIFDEERGKRAGQIDTLRRKIERIRAGSVEPTALMPGARYPRPSSQGVYSDEAAERLDCVVGRASVTLRVLETASGEWIWSASYEVKGSGVGCGSVSGRLQRGRSAPTREAALLAAATEAGLALQERLTELAQSRRPEVRKLLTWLDEQVAGWSTPATDWTAAWNAWAEGKPTLDRLPCAGCGAMLNLADGVYTAVIDGQERPVCEGCRGAEKGEPADETDVIASVVAADSPLAMSIPWNLREVEAGDTVCGQLMPGGSIYRCPVLRVEPEALVIRVLFGEKAIPWTEPALATWEIVKRAGQEEALEQPSCTECGLVLGSADAGQGQRVGEALLCGQCLSTNTVREKHGLELIPADGWAAKRTTAGTEGPQPASPKFQPGDLIEWAEGDGQVTCWLGMVLGVWPHDPSAHRVLSYRPEISVRKVSRCAVQGHGVGRPAQSKPRPVTELQWTAAELLAAKEPIRGAKQLRPGLLVENRAERDICCLMSRATTGSVWLGVVVSPGNRTDLVIGQEVRLQTLELVNGYQLRDFPPIPKALIPAPQPTVAPAEEYVVIAVAAAAKGDAATWPMNGSLYRGTVWEPLAEHLVIDTSEPVVKRMTVERKVEGLVVMTKGGAK